MGLFHQLKVYNFQKGCQGKQKTIYKQLNKAKGAYKPTLLTGSCIFFKRYYPKNSVSINFLNPAEMTLKPKLQLNVPLNVIQPQQNIEPGHHNLSAVFHLIPRCDYVFRVYSR